jgi:translation initiation factor IF-2
LVKAGELIVGDYAAWINGYSKVRSLKDENLANLEKAEVSDPVWVVGLDQVLPTGETLYCFDNEADAKNHIQVKEAKEEVSSEETEETSDEDLLASLFEDAREDTRKILKVVLRADVQGSLEVLETELKKLEDDEVGIEIINSGTGDISEDDIQKAKDVKGVIIGFRSEVSSRIKKVAQRQKVLLMTYELIYELLDDVDEALSSLVEPEEEEEEVALASVKKIFELTNGDIVAGCNVTKGTIIKGYRAYVRRGEERLGEGKIISLRHLKNEVKEAKKGTECGILLAPKVEVEEGDEIVCFKVEKV